MARRVLIGLLGCCLLVEPVAAGPQSRVHAQDPAAVEIPFGPTPGMRLVYQILTHGKITNPDGKQVAGSDKTTRRMEIVGCRGDVCDVRMASDRGPAPATFQLTTTGTVDKIVLDRIPLSPEEMYTLGYAVSQFLFAVIHQHTWVPGETRPLTLVLPHGYEELQARMKDLFLGRVTFRRLVSVYNRTAAEFDYAQSVYVPSAALAGLQGKGPVKALMTGQHWVDWKTGIPLQTTGAVTATFTVSGKLVSIEARRDEDLVFEESRGLWKRD